MSKGTAKLHHLSRFMGKKWWQGVAGVTALVTLGCGFIATQGGSPGTSSSVEHAGQLSTIPEAQVSHSTDQAQQGNLNNNPDNQGCMIQGNGNSCEIRKILPTPSYPSQSLDIKPTWPLGQECDAATSVAVFSRSKSPEKWVTSPGDDPRPLLTKSGAAVFGDGHLYLYLTVLNNSIVHVQDIRAYLIKRSRTVPKVQWVLEPEGGCGDDYSRVFKLNLDKGMRLIDKGVQGDPRLGYKGVRADPLGLDSFTLTRQQGATIRIDALACHGYYDWGVVVDYSANGREFQWNSRLKGLLLHSAGALGGDVPDYGLSGDIYPIGTISQPFACRGDQ